MSLAGLSGDREKLDCLLQLSLEQVRALEADDMSAFDRILEAKSRLVELFQDLRALTSADSSLDQIIRRIQEADKSAQHLLYRKTGRLMRQLTEIDRLRRARSLYGAPGTQRAEILPTDVSRFLDRKS